MWGKRLFALLYREKEGQKICLGFTLFTLRSPGLGFFLVSKKPPNLATVT